MFQKFTPSSRQVVVLAHDEARGLGHHWIGTEHLLLGLLREDVVATGQIPFTPRAKKVLEFALRESGALGRSSIGTEHVLLGLCRDPDGVALHVTAALGADAERIRIEVLRQLGNDVASNDL
jgi:ATP-dependent Clp protease ATP-binding subunit ClpC